MPLAPWMTASQSSAMSHTFQNGSDSLPPTNAKSMALMPSPWMRLT